MNTIDNKLKLERNRARDRLAYSAFAWEEDQKMTTKYNVRRQEKPQPKCAHCEKLCHTREYYWNLHNRPSWRRGQWVQNTYVVELTCLLWQVESNMVINHNLTSKRDSCKYSNHYLHQYAHEFILDNEAMNHMLGDKSTLSTCDCVINYLLL